MVGMLHEKFRNTGLAIVSGLCVVLATGVLNIQTAVAEGLREAVVKQSGKYLEVPTLKGEMIGVNIEAGSIDKPTKPVSISSGAVSAEVSYEETQDGEEPAFTSKVTILEDGEKVGQIDVDENTTRYPYHVQILELDPSNDTPEAVVSTYSGGAHCCGVVQVVSKNAEADTWSVIDVGQFDGDSPVAMDYNDDGRAEFTVSDNAFLYTFGAYAFSVAPQMVLTIEDGKVMNLSADPAFQDVQKSWMKRLVDHARDDYANAYLAGYVAQKSLLGEGQEAWDLMLKHFDRKDDWGLESCDQPLTESGVCPGKEITLTYPEMLKRILTENGYEIGG